MSDEAGESSFEEGDVLELATKVFTFVLMVASYEPNPAFGTTGARVGVVWFDHPDPLKVGSQDWMWEQSLRAEAAWTRVAGPGR